MYTDIIAAKQVYEDQEFNGRQTLYWFGFGDFGKQRDYEWALWFGNHTFKRVVDVYPDATLFGNNNPQWHDIYQNAASDSYIMASLGALAEFPSLVQEIFVTKEKNDAGIYAFKFFIRGKPWIVTVDDYFLFWKTSAGVEEGYFAKIG